MFIVPKSDALRAGCEENRYEVDGPVFEVVDAKRHAFAVGSRVKRFIKDGCFSGYVNADGHTQWVRDSDLVEVQHD